MSSTVCRTSRLAQLSDYSDGSLSSQSAQVKDEIDPAFINDQYWLLFPLHTSWEGSADVEDAGMHKLPLGRVPLSR